jgi:hypothetical protein
MIPPIDVFKIENSKPSWIGFAETTAQALEIARKKGSGSYFVFSNTGGRKLYQIGSDGIIRPAYSLNDGPEL